MSTNNLMSGTLSYILNRMLNEAAKTDTALAAAMKTKMLDDCVAAIFDALCKLVGHKNAAVNGSDDLLLSAAVHWYTEQNPTIDSIVDILKGGTEVHKLEKPKAATPKATPKPGKKAAPAPVAADDDFDVDDDAPTPTPAPKTEPKPKATPTPNATLFADDDFDVD